MGLPEKPPVLNAAQLEDLNTRLAKMRHEVNNQLCLIQAAIEIAQFRPEKIGEVFQSLSDPPKKILAEVADFSRQFERTFGITRD